jgi:hypothetical protein
LADICVHYYAIPRDQMYDVFIAIFVLRGRTVAVRVDLALH